MMGHHGLHDTLPVSMPNGRVVQIDADLAEIIGLLWQHGVRTVECCQDDVERTPGMANIDFASVATAVRFVRRVVQYVQESTVTDLDDSDFVMHMRWGLPGLRVLMPVRAIPVATEAWR